jgi:hypothetical protein
MYTTGREKLADDLTRSLEAECGVSSAYTTASSNFSNSNKLLLSTSNQEQDVPDNRLITLLQQAVAYQMEFKRYHPNIVPQVNSYNMLYILMTNNQSIVVCATFES